MSSVLLIEPDKLLATSYAAALKKAGHKVVWRQTAGKSIHAIDGFNPDVIVLELQLSTNNGVEFLYELRSYADWLNIPVIILSHLPKPAIKIPAIGWNTLGIIDYLYKPQTKLAQLVDAVNRTVGLKTSR